VCQTTSSLLQQFYFGALNTYRTFFRYPIIRKEKELLDAKEEMRRQREREAEEKLIRAEERERSSWRGSAAERSERGGRERDGGGRDRDGEARDRDGGGRRQDESSNWRRKLEGSEPSRKPEPWRPSGEFFFLFVCVCVSDGWFAFS